MIRRKLAITALLKEMKTNFDYIIVDLPRHLLASQKRLESAGGEGGLATAALAGDRYSGFRHGGGPPKL